MWADTMQEIFDVAVVGMGAMGSASFACMAGEGLKVIGLEQSDTAIHDYSSSQGETRLTRLAYFEHSDYVPLLDYAHRYWPRIEERVNKALFHKVGLTIFAETNSDLYQGVIKSSKLYDIPVQIAQENPVPHLIQGTQLPSVTEASAGYLMCEDIIHTFQKIGQEDGGQIAMSSDVEGFKKEGDLWSILIRGKQNVQAKKIVITTGAFYPSFMDSLNQRIPHLSKNLRVERVPLFWFPVKDKSKWSQATSFALELPQGFLYGFPSIDGETIKLAFHKPAGVLQHPRDKSNEISNHEMEEIEYVASQYIQDIHPKILRSKVCLYTMSSDEHFIVDKWPDCQNIFFATGFSGHGFKFSPAIARVLTDWVQEKDASLPIDFLNHRRATLGHQV